MNAFPARGKQWRKEYRKQRREHPTLPAWALRMVVSDHIRKGKNYG